MSLLPLPAREDVPVSLPAEGEQLVLGLSDASIQARFQAFHRRNPEVFAELRRLALDYQLRGYPCIGIKHLVEVLRWQRRAETFDPTSQFKVNNSYTSRYARLLQDEEPRLRGFILTRELHSA